MWTRRRSTLPRSRVHLSRVPSLLVEVLRFCVVLFGAAAGFEVARALAPDARLVVGPFDAVTAGLIVGSGLGYALGGVLARWAVAAVGRTERSLHERPAEELITGSVGAVVGLLAGSTFAWPLFLVTLQALALPTFLFIAIVASLLGYRIGAAKSDAVLGLIGTRAGVVPRQGSASALPKLLDASVLLDGRLVDVVRAGFLHGRMVITSPVLASLSVLTESDDEVRKAAGRRGLDLIDTLRGERGVTLEVVDDPPRDDPRNPERGGCGESPDTTVSASLIRSALARGCSLVTLDRSLARVAELAGVRVLDLGALAVALRPPIVAGDEVEVALLRPGKDPGQAVGYLDDGTMVVAERSRAAVGETVVVLVTSVLTTANGRMVFGRPVCPVTAPSGQQVPSPALVFARANG